MQSKDVRFREPMRTDESREQGAGAGGGAGAGRGRGLLFCGPRAAQGGASPSRLPLVLAARFPFSAARCLPDVSHFLPGSAQCVCVFILDGPLHNSYFSEKLFVTPFPRGVRVQEIIPALFSIVPGLRAAPHPLGDFFSSLLAQAHRESWGSELRTGLLPKPQMWASPRAFGAAPGPLCAC